MKAGKMRTFGGLQKRHQQFLVAGGKLVDAKRFANCIHDPLIKEDDNVHVISVVPPGELHLLIGAVDVLFNVLVKMFGLKAGPIQILADGPIFRTSQRIVRCLFALRCFG